MICKRQVLYTGLAIVMISATLGFYQLSYAQTISSNQTSVPASSVEITVKAVPALRYDANGSVFIPGKVYCFQDADGKPIIFEDGPQCIFVR
ncbi:MAG: hypothetical protein WA421_09485 [Nitrososphaeraceae archaeon]